MGKRSQKGICDTGSGTSVFQTEWMGCWMLNEDISLAAWRPKLRSLAQWEQVGMFNYVKIFEALLSASSQNLKSWVASSEYFGIGSNMYKVEAIVFHCDSWIQLQLAMWWSKLHGWSSSAVWYLRRDTSKISGDICMKALHPPFPPALYSALPLALNLTLSNFKTFLSYPVQVPVWGGGLQWCRKERWLSPT